MITKLRINLNEGLIEVEGSAEFVQQIYSDFKDQLSAGVEIPSKIKKKVAKKAVKKSASKGSESTKKRTTGKPDTLKILGDLDLAKAGNTPSLKEFLINYKPETFYDNNILFVYYLEQHRKIEKITVNHIFTCYRDTGTKLPNTLKQTLIDTKRKKGWIKYEKLDDIKLDTAGMNYIEHDIKKNES